MSGKEAQIKNAIANVVQVKKYKKHSHSVSKHHVNGPPSKVEDFSSNWKRFLNNQKQKGQAMHMKQKQLKNTGQRPKSQGTLKSINSSGDKHVNVVQEHDKTNNIKYNRKRKRTHKKETVDVKSNEIWFDVNPDLLQKSITGCNSSHIISATASGSMNAKTDTLKNIDTNEKDKSLASKNLTRYIALDCEMVGVGTDGKESILARVSIVNSLCECIYDEYVMPKEKVIDYRTHVSGIRPSDLKDALDYFAVQKDVSELLKGRVLVGHALQNDMKVLMLSHSKKNIRDTSKYKPFRKLLKTKRPALKKLADEILHKEIQVGEHNSVVDAQIAMQLYKKYKKEWEKSLHMERGSTKKEINLENKDHTRKSKMNKYKKIRERKKQKENEG